MSTLPSFQRAKSGVVIRWMNVSTLILWSQWEWIVAMMGTSENSSTLTKTEETQPEQAEPVREDHGLGTDFGGSKHYPEGALRPASDKEFAEDGLPLRVEHHKPLKHHALCALNDYYGTRCTCNRFKAEAGGATEESSDTR